MACMAQDLHVLTVKILSLQGVPLKFDVYFGRH